MAEELRKCDQTYPSNEQIFDGMRRRGLQRASAGYVS